MPKTFDASDILRITDDLQEQIEDLNCEIEACCSKHPENCGEGAQVYKGYSCGHWQFRTLVAGDNITIEEDNCEIIISATGGTDFTCADVNTCLGISDSGNALYFLNQKGEWVAVGGGGFTCSSLNSCSTTNLPEGSNLYFTDERAQDSVGNILTNSPQITFTYNDGVPSISAAFASNNISQFTNDSGYITCSDVNSCITGTQNQVLYYNNLGNLTSSAYFTREPNGDTQIIGDSAGQDGGYIGLNQLGKSYFGVYSAGLLYNHFWADVTGTGWDWNGTNFMLPTSDGSSNFVMVTDGSGVLSFADVNTIVTGSLITAIADTNTVDLTETGGTLTADVNYQNSTTINLSEDASGLKADIVNSVALAGNPTTTTQAITDNSTKIATTAFVNSFFNADNFRRVYTDLTGFGTNISANTDVGADWRITVGNTGSTARDTASYSNALGVLNFLTNANAGGRVCMLSFGWYLGSKFTSHKSKLKIPVLATNAQNFYSGVGLVDSSQFSVVTNGVIVYCINGVNSGNWVIQTITSSVSTTFNTSVTPVADTFTTIEIQINAAGNQVRVFFDGIEPSGIGYPLTTNIPAASATQLFGAVCIEKSNGTTSRTLSVDYIDSKQY